MTSVQPSNGADVVGAAGRAPPSAMVDPSTTMPPTLSRRALIADAAAAAGGGLLNALPLGATGVQLSAAAAMHDATAAMPALPAEQVMNARSLPAVRMPARNRFVRDDRKDVRPSR